MMIVWVLVVSSIALPPVQGARVTRTASALIGEEEFPSYCKEHGATFFGKACTCDNGMVCKKGEEYGCADFQPKHGDEQARGELYKFTMEEWQNGEQPTCVENPCSEKQAKITYQDDQERWVCECKSEGHCHAGGTHCPVENGLKFAKQFLTSCYDCGC
jgi:hypothetical protein